MGIGWGVEERVFQAGRGNGLRRGQGGEEGVHVAECGWVHRQVGDDVGPKTGEMGRARPERALSALAGAGMR